ncbi:hypothetical protein [Micromonospora sp. KC721]|uniref:hypothetical protein n=1 Tax=Micromonospora sp. KC721 TaxID=2530380 RepID=UPI00140527F2|nr:hypothetical protein [Micromonospora sp. KC721]
MVLDAVGVLVLGQEAGDRADAGVEGFASQFVFDDSADQVFVVWPGEGVADVVKEWPW